jgi:hypothetical protein
VAIYRSNAVYEETMIHTLKVASRSRAAAEAEMIVARTTTADWIQLVRAEYLEMPGLQLTRNQVQRLWGLDTFRCEAILEALIDAKFLRRTHGGAYVLADGGG